MAEHDHAESAPAREPPRTAVTPTGPGGPLLGSAGPSGLFDFLAVAAVDARAEYTGDLQRTIGNRAVSRLILARASTEAPPRPPSSLTPKADPHGGLTMDPEVLERAAKERKRIGIEDEDFRRNVAVIKFERDGKIGYEVAANTPDQLHSEEVLIGKLNKDDPGLGKTKILEVFSEREPCAGRCKPLLLPYREKMKHDFPLHHWVPEEGTLGERAELLRGKYKKEGLLTELAPKKGPPDAPPEAGGSTKKKGVAKGKDPKTAQKAKKTQTPGSPDMGQKKAPGPLKGPIINFGVGIGTALLTSLMHDAILNTVQAMPRPTLETVDIWSRGGIGKAKPIDLAGADLKLELENFQTGRAQMTIEMVGFWHELDKAPPAERAGYIASAEDAILADQGKLVEAQRNVTAALSFREQIMEGVDAAHDLQELIGHPVGMQYLMGLGFSIEELLKIRDNLAMYQAVFTRGVIEPLDRLYVGIDEAIEANDEIFAQLEARRALERRRAPAPPSTPPESRTPGVITVEPLR